jgi:putative PIN family toxin of toxin-antitoxin system
MSTTPPRVVLDTVVFVQTLISGRGASARCIDRLLVGHFILLLSDDLIAEMLDVPLRPELVRKYPYLTAERVEAFARQIECLAVAIHSPPKVFPLPRDPKDEPLIDLAVAGSAEFIVTWNERHLTYLMKRDTPDGREFCGRYPAIRILSPPELLTELDRRATSS